MGNKERAEYYWNIWYSMAPKKSNNRQALWETDTFDMWYNRKGNDLNFRKLSLDKLLKMSYNIHSNWRKL